MLLIVAVVGLALLLFPPKLCFFLNIHFQPVSSRDVFLILQNSQKCRNADEKRAKPRQVKHGGREEEENRIEWIHE